MFSHNFIQEILMAFIPGFPKTSFSGFTIRTFYMVILSKICPRISLQTLFEYFFGIFFNNTKLLKNSLGNLWRNFLKISSDDCLKKSLKTPGKKSSKKFLEQILDSNSLEFQDKNFLSNIRIYLWSISWLNAYHGTLKNTRRNSSRYLFNS